jgi:hypothetical protein
MAAEMGCAEVRELASELALDVLGGEERDAALRHLTGCPECRRLVAELSSIGEDLLVLAPPREPPPGFESRVLAAIAEPTVRPVIRAPVRRRRRWVRAMAVAAAVIVAAALCGGSAYLATAGDRRLAAGYRSVLAEGRGAFFAAAPLRGPDGRIGTVFGYEGRPSWVMVTLQPPIGEESEFEVRILTRHGRDLVLGDAILGGDNEAWGRQIPVDLSAVREVRFVGSDGRAAFTATFDSTSPWD